MDGWRNALLLSSCKYEGERPLKWYYFELFPAPSFWAVLCSGNETKDDFSIEFIFSSFYNPRYDSRLFIFLSLLWGIFHLSSHDSIGILVRFWIFIGLLLSRENSQTKRLTWLHLECNDEKLSNDRNPMLNIIQLIIRKIVKNFLREKGKWKEIFLMFLNFGLGVSKRDLLPLQKFDSFFYVYQFRKSFI